MKLFITSILTSLLISLTSYFIGGESLTLKVNFYIGISLLVIAMIMSGSLVSGDRMRANFHTSTPEDRKQNNKWTGRLIIISIPFITVSVLLYFL
ncbi:DUF5316 domain-containing protein [Cohnella lupini]|uniref:DUF5316 domain-containing protein n=1 Tax=Cohnella lupini TaxID=1294267 RepID=A0A3D9IWG0_9BACL|nr:DUF5316 domain-containing protein [Cohnella lupini]RED66158.1 hypothetical protein DFP95_101656 [Cohnella lupini]